MFDLLDPVSYFGFEASSYDEVLFVRSMMYLYFVDSEVSDAISYESFL